MSPHTHEALESFSSSLSNEQSKGAPISGPLMQEKALSFFRKLFPDAYPESFKVKCVYPKIQAILRYGQQETFECTLKHTIVQY